MPLTPQSPPKRMTRARAKAVEETKNNIKTTKITTPAAKAAAETRNTKRKARTDDNENNPSDSQQDSTPASTQPDFARPTKSQTNRNVANSRTGTISKTTAKGEVKTNAPKPGRGRPRKDAVKPESQAADDHANDAGPTTRTRARAGSVAAAGPSKAVATKKKVTFEEETLEKENIAPVVAGKKPTVSKVTKQQGGKQPAGLNAKPAKKDVAVPSLSKNSEANQNNKVERNEARAEPLSPKKATQVAKGDAFHENDAHETVNVNSVQATKSPLKQSHGNGMSRPSSKDGANDFGQGREPGSGARSSDSPVQYRDASIIGSPAKRPPTSPFKNSMKATPLRLGRSPNKEDPTANLPALQESMIGKSPPKKFTLADTQPSFDASTNAGLNSSLLQSPPRKPQSPIKFPGFDSSTRASPSKMDFNASSAVGISGSPQRSRFSPVKNLTCSLKAAKSQTSPIRLHKVAIDEQAIFEDELANAPCLVSPVRTTQTPRPSEAKSHRPASSERTSNMDSFTRDDFLEGQWDGDVLQAQAPAVHEDDHSMTPPGLPANMKRPSVGLNFREEYHGLEDESEDELQSSGPKPKNGTASTGGRQSLGALDPQTPRSNNAFVAPGPMTTLAQKFGQWKGATPDMRIVEQRKLERAVFSPAKIESSANEDWKAPEPEEASILELDDEERTSEFEAAMISNDVEDITITDAPPDILTEDAFRASQMSEASQEYGDENAVPIDLALLEPNAGPAFTCTPERLFLRNPHVVHTVSKVPLKPADNDDSPLLRPKKRSHSMTGSLSPGGELELQALRQIHQPVIGLAADDFDINGSSREANFTGKLDEDQTVTPRAVSCPGPSTPSGKSATWSTVATPMRTPRAGLDMKLLSGAVVFVDVHTSEGADASGIFIELLNQMGARCVKQWNWNPKGSSSPEQVSSEASDPDTSRIGITHVVFKDGGKRTMEKVRDARGVVQCVGVGWVLDCERENKWLDEAEYAIDRSTIPRGGHRRRKSMEPKALSSRQSVTGVFRPPVKTSELSPTKEFLDLSSPVPRRETVAFPMQERRRSIVPTGNSEDQETQATPRKPQTPVTFNTPGIGAPSEFGSPATPYFLHPESLVQQTCPPKQPQELFFPVTGCIGDQPDSTIRQRLLLARRKSLQFAPKVGSPLSRPDM